MRVKSTKLHKLHEKLAEVLLETIENGEVREVEGVPMRLTPSAAILNVARQFLKDNDIQGIPAEGTPLNALTEAARAQLPFKEAGEDTQALMAPDRDLDESEF